MMRAHFVFRVAPCHYATATDATAKGERSIPKIDRGQPTNDRLKSIIEAPDFHVRDAQRNVMVARCRILNAQHSLPLLCGCSDLANDGAMGCDASRSSCAKRKSRSNPQGFLKADAVVKPKPTASRTTNQDAV
jgi:hypothetical protein